MGCPIGQFVNLHDAAYHTPIGSAGLAWDAVGLKSRLKALRAAKSTDVDWCASRARAWGFRRRFGLNLGKHLQEISVGITEEERAMPEGLVGGR